METNGTNLMLANDERQKRGVHRYGVRKGGRKGGRKGKR